MALRASHLMKIWELDQAGHTGLVFFTKLCLCYKKMRIQVKISKLIEGGTTMKPLLFDV